METSLTLDLTKLSRIIPLQACTERPLNRKKLACISSEVKHVLCNKNAGRSEKSTWSKHMHLAKFFKHGMHFDKFRGMLNAGGYEFHG